MKRKKNSGLDFSFSMICFSMMQPSFIFILKLCFYLKFLWIIVFFLFFLFFDFFFFFFLCLMIFGFFTFQALGIFNFFFNSYLSNIFSQFINNPFDIVIFRHLHTNLSFSPNYLLFYFFIFLIFLPLKKLSNFKIKNHFFFNYLFSSPPLKFSNFHIKSFVKINLTFSKTSKKLFLFVSFFAFSAFSAVLNETKATILGIFFRKKKSIKKFQSKKLK